MTFGERVKYFRHKRHLTQKELGKHIGIREETVRKYELGTLNPKNARIKEIAEALEIHPNALTEDNALELEYKTVGDVMSLLITLENVVGLTFEGLRDNEGYLDPSTICLRIEDDQVNKVIADWEYVRKDRLEQKQITHEKIFESLKKSKEKLDIQDLLNVLNYDPIKGYQESTELAIMSIQTPLNSKDEDEEIENHDTKD